MGIQYTDSPGEADPQCVAIALHNSDKCVGIISDDTDIVVFGGAKILTKFNVKEGRTVEISSESIILFLLEKANEIKHKSGKPLIDILTRKNFIDFAILMGTDYGDVLDMCCKGEKINLSELFEIFTFCDFDVPNTLKHLQTKYDLPFSDEPQKLWESIRMIYLESYAYDPRSIDIMMKKPNIAGLIEFLCAENEFDKTYVLQGAREIMKSYDTFNKMYEQKDDAQEFRSFRSYRHRHCSRHDVRHKHVYNFPRNPRKLFIDESLMGSST